MLDLSDCFSMVLVAQVLQKKQFFFQHFPVAPDSETDRNRKLSREILSQKPIIPYIHPDIPTVEGSMTRV